MAVSFTLKQPLEFVNGTGFTTTPPGDIFATDVTNVIFSIGQDVSSTSDVVFNQLTATPPILIDNGIFKLDDGSITGSYTHTGNFSILNNFTFGGNLSIGGKLTAEKIQTEVTQSTIIFKSGSTQFGDSLDDTHIFSGSLFLSGSHTMGHGVTGISNDTNLTDSSTTDLFTENALNNHVSVIASSDEVVYLRKSFTKVGSFVSNTTASFTAVTASAPSGFTSTSELDFMFFNNGMIMEYDALDIQQSGSLLFLKINSNSLGYELKSTDEVVAFGKFNS